MSGILEHHSRLRRLPLGIFLFACLLLVALPPATADQAPRVQDAVWGVSSANIQRMWATTKGQGVKVAVIDSGVDALHPDLLGQVESGGDYGDGSTANGLQDVGGDKGHGTEIASLIAGTGMAFRHHGLQGLAPGAKIVSFGVYENKEPNAHAVAKAVRAAVAKGAGVMVLPPVAGAGADVASAVRHAIARDVVVISGTGAGTQLAKTSPVDAATPRAASIHESVVPGVLRVAAVDRQGALWPEGGGGKHVVVGAPGVQVIGAATDGTYWIGDDSSFAAAWVAGVAALIRAEHQSWSAAQTIEKIISTAQSTGSRCSRGCGYGIVDSVRAVTDMSRPAVKGNPLLNTPAPPRSPENPFAGVPAERILLFVVSSLAALALYVAVTALFIRRTRGRGGGLDGTGA